MLKPPTTDPHKCFADGCTRMVDSSILMCIHHWRMIPRALRNEIWSFYRVGQEIDHNPSEEYLNAALRARIAVKEREDEKSVAKTKQTP